MDISKIRFKNATAEEVQAAIRAFLDVPLPLPKFVDGQVVRQAARRVTPNLLACGLGGDLVRANALFAELVAEGYLDEGGKPLAPAMALAHDKGLPRILREEVDRIIVDLVAEADRLNGRTGARVFVERIELFGSTLRVEPDYGDVDVVVHLTEPTVDFTPEHLDEQDEVLDALQEVSEHISMTNLFDLAADAATKKVIYARRANLSSSGAAVDAGAGT
jgi:predicted nucleotidyltransferase